MKDVFRGSNERATMPTYLRSAVFGEDTAWTTYSRLLLRSLLRVRSLRSDTYVIQEEFRKEEEILLYRDAPRQANKERRSSVGHIIQPATVSETSLAFAVSAARDIHPTGSAPVAILKYSPTAIGLDCS